MVNMDKFLLRKIINPPKLTPLVLKKKLELLLGTLARCLENLKKIYRTELNPGRGLVLSVKLEFVGLSSLLPLCIHNYKK